MLQIGSVIDGKYKILNKIGQGGMSVVYLAMNERANKQWAVKEVRKDGVSNFEVVKQGLVAEVDLLKKLNHPHLPSIIDVIDGDGSFLIVMDYIEGVALDKKLKEAGGALPQDDVIEWGKQLCDVLGYLHSRERPIIYRDMKPSNVMLKPNGDVTLIDFGTAREFKSNSVADTTCLGTQGYAAPEQFGGQGQTDARTDIYCLGATLYHLVTGHNPCEYPYEMYPIRQWNPALSSGLEAIILKCTQKNPNDRYQSCAELMYALEHYKDFEIETIKRQNSKWYSFLAVLIASIVFLGASGGFKFKSERDNKWLFETNISKATTYEDFESLSAAAELYPKKIEPYTKALEIIDKDGVFTTQESMMFSKYLYSSETESDDKRKALLESGDFIAFSYDMGLEYFFCYETDAGLSYCQKWFQRVINNSDGIGDTTLSQNDLNNAQILYQLSAALSSMKNSTDSGTVSADTTLMNPGEEDEKTGEIKYSYADFWNQLTGLLDLDFFKSANSATKRKVYSWILDQMQFRIDKLKKAGVSEDSILRIRDKSVEDMRDTLNTIGDPEKDSYKEIQTLIEKYSSVNEYWK